jgi:2-dehydropantoate 2-reductase
VKKKTLIYGGGAIGSYLGACLLNSNHQIYFLTRKRNYEYIKDKGLLVNVFNNNNLVKKFFLKNTKNFIIINSLKKLDKIHFDNIFITTKINESLDKIFLDIEKFINNKTIIITPCTSIPFWWHKCLNKTLQKKINNSLSSLFKKNIERKNLVGMTMWLSGKIEKPGFVKIAHIQRGFPIKEAFPEKKKQVNELRKDLKKNTKSPLVKNIFSEVFIKSINSLAFNMIALKYEQNNSELNKNDIAKREIISILKEGDKILKNNNVKIYQSPESRVIQTLKSNKHTMSMLHAYQTKKEIELKFLWQSFVNLKKFLKFDVSNTEIIYKQLKRKLWDYLKY